MFTYLILTHNPMEFGLSADLFLHAIIDEIIHCSIRPDEDILSVTTIFFLLNRVSFYKEFFIAKHLAVFVTVYRLAPDVHSIGGNGPLEYLGVKHPVRTIASSQWH